MYLNIVYVFCQVKVKNENVTFALKCIKKRHIVDNRQEEHVHSERRILRETCSPFIVKYVEIVCTYNVSCLFIQMNRMQHVFLSYACSQPCMQGSSSQ